MKATLTDRFLLVERDEHDTPVQPYTNWSRPKRHPERTEYRICFETQAEAEVALRKVNKIGDYDRAAAWLDKQ